MGKEIYQKIENEISNINLEIPIDLNFNQKLIENIQNSTEGIRKILNNLNVDISNLEENSEWKTYTISFIGETNAGKSTIIEALRIKYNEPEKKNITEKNFTITSEINELESKLKLEEENFNIQKETQNNKLTSQLNILNNKSEKKIKSFFAKIILLFNKNYVPFKKEMEIIENELKENTAKNFFEIETVKNDISKIEINKSNIVYDGEIIGDGRLDFTQGNKEYSIYINDEEIKLIDVPGIEGDEVKFEKIIETAVQKSHCVFYVTRSSKPLELGTVQKVKKYIKNQADIYAILNLNLNQYKTEYLNESFEKIYHNQLQSIDSIDEQLNKELNENFIRILPLNGHWSFLSSANFLKEGKFSKDLTKLLSIFNNKQNIEEKSNFISIEKAIIETISQKDIKIEKINRLKITALIDQIIFELKQNDERYLNHKFLNEINEQGDRANSELNALYIKVQKKLHGLKEFLLNNFKNTTYSEIRDYINKNDIDKEKYNSQIQKIIENNQNKFKKEIENEINNVNNNLGIEIQSILEKFLDRLSILSTTNSISFSNSNINVDFDFTLDNIKMGFGYLARVGGLAMSGFALGSIIPGIGNVAGAIIGGIVGLFASIFTFFQSTESKKAKILYSIDIKLKEQLKIIDKDLDTSFNTMLNDINSNTINKNIALVNNIIQLYKLRKEQINNVINQLDSIK